MATIDRIVLRIEGDLADINKKLDKLERQVNQTTEKSSANFKKLANIAKTVIGAVVVQQVSKATLSLVNFSGNVDELRSKSAAVFKEFTGTVRAELDSFGNAVGRSTSELEMMASQVQDTFVPMGFARGEAADLSVALTKLAVDVASFNNANDVDTMRAFQSALVGNHEAVRRFGIVITEAELKAELLRMGIKKNSNEVDAQTKVQARLNLILAGTTDAQGDALRTADSFQNTSRALRAVLMELGDELGNTLVPLFTSLTRGLINAAEAFREFALATGIATARTETISEMRKEVERLDDVISRTSNVPASRFDGNGLFFGQSAMNQLLEAQKARARFLRESIKLERMSFEQRKRLNEEVKKTPPLNKKFVDSLEDVKRQNQTIVALIHARTDAERKLIEMRAKTKLTDLSPQQNQDLNLEMQTLIANQKILENRNNEIARANNLVDASVTANQKFQDDLLSLKFLLDEKLVSQEDYNRAVAHTTKEYNELVKKTEELSSVDQKFISVVEQLGTTLEDSFISALDGTKSALDGFKDFSRQLVTEILRTYTRLAVINPIINRAFKGVPGFTPRDTMGGGDILTNFFNIGRKALGFAGGGTIQGRRPVMVGERGPEMFIPNTGGRIVPNGALGGSLKGGSSTVVNQSLNFATGVQETVRAEIFNMLPAIQKATLNAVVDQKRRGGAFAQGMT